MSEDSRLYWIWLAESLGQGSTVAASLINRFKAADKIYDGAVDQMEPDEEFTEEKLGKIRAKLCNRSLARAEEIVKRCEKCGANIITYASPDYPKTLKTIRNFPLVLYARGKMPDCDNNMLTAIVGTRTMTDYGRRIAYTLGTGLAYGGAVVVSGMALGADSMALLGALEANGKTITVLGSGVDVIYPKEHTEIYYKLMNNGAVISEYPPGTPPIGSHFPVRNRIMSGLSDATVIVEGNQTSGAMITANYALQQGKKLFAVPGKVGESGAEGPNLLIQDGALPCICPEDILSEFEFIYNKTLNLQGARVKMRRLDFETLSKEAMERMRIGTRGGAGNYYGKGTYGGRIRDNNAAKAAYAADNNVTLLDKSSSNVAEKPKKIASKPTNKLNDNGSAVNNNIGTNKVNKRENNQISAKKVEKSEEKMIFARKIELDMLDDSEIKIYNKMKPNVPTLPDSLVDSSTPISEIMSALTILEIAGAVESGGGGYFMRVSEEDIMQISND